MVKEFPELLSDEIIARASRLCSTLVCDGMKDLDVPNGGCVGFGIHAVHPSFKLVGTAMTVETADGDNFPIHVASYSAPGEGYVMVIDGKGYTGRAYLGDLIMGACQAVGYKGIVIDGCTRDYEGNCELEFPVFSLGLLPRGPFKKNEGNINTPIMCGGVRVEPGDLIVADCDGIAVVPRKDIDKVLAAAEKKQDYENNRHTAIEKYKEAKAKGTELPQLAPQWVLDMMKK